MRGFDYENDVPVADVMTALDLLKRGWNDGTTREIRLWPHSPPHIQIGHHHDFSDSTFDRFLVAPELPAQMLAMGVVAGKPQWGYTEMRELRITERGEAYVWDERTRLGKDFPSAANWLRRRSEAPKGGAT